MLLVKDAKASADFYQNALGVTIIAQSEKMAQIDTGGTPIILKVTWPPPRISMTITTPGKIPVLDFLSTVFGAVVSDATFEILINRHNI